MVAGLGQQPVLVQLRGSLHRRLQLFFILLGYFIVVIHFVLDLDGEHSLPPASDNFFNPGEGPPHLNLNIFRVSGVPQKRLLNPRSNSFEVDQRHILCGFDAFEELQQVGLVVVLVFRINRELFLLLGDFLPQLLVLQLQVFNLQNDGRGGVVIVFN